MCLCAGKCYVRVPVEVWLKELNKYWNLGSYDAQTAYLGVLVKEVSVKRLNVKKDLALGGNKKSGSKTPEFEEVDTTTQGNEKDVEKTKETLQEHIL